MHTPSAYVAAEVVAELGVDPYRVRAVHHGDTEPARPPPGAGRNGALPVALPGRVRPLRPGGRHHRAAEGLPAAGPGVRVGGRRPPRRRPGARREGRLGSRALRRRGGGVPGTGPVVRPGWLTTPALAASSHGAAVLAYPSLYEGFGFPPLQAMAAGVPVVATAAGALPEVVGDGAWLVPPGDADALAGGWPGAIDGGTEVMPWPTGTGPRRRRSAGTVRRGAGRPVPRRRGGRAGREHGGGERAPALLVLWRSSSGGRRPEGSGPTSSGCSRASTNWRPPSEPRRAPLAAHRQPAPAGPDPLAAPGAPLLTSPLPGPLLTRAWGLGLVGPRPASTSSTPSRWPPSAGRGARWW